MSLLRNASLIALGLTILSTSMAQAQSLNAHEPIVQENCVTGTIDITMGKRELRTNDFYRLSINVANWTAFQGTVVRTWGQYGLPSWRGERSWRPIQMNYDMNNVSILPNNQALRLGQLKGVVAVDDTGRYTFRGHGVEPLALQRFSVDRQPVGAAASFDGSIQGKPASAYDENSVRSVVSNFTRNIMGRPVPMAGVTATDPLRFNNVQMAGGPWTSLFNATLSGDFTYAYRCPPDNLKCRDGIWTTQNGMQLAYANSNPARGRITDALSGTMEYKDITVASQVEVIEYRDANNPTVRSSARITPTGSYDVGMLFNAESDNAAGDDQLVEQASREANDDDILLALANRGTKPSLTGKIYFVDQRDGNDKLETSKAYFQLKCNNISRAQAANFMRAYQLMIASLHDD